MLDPGIERLAILNKPRGSLCLIDRCLLSSSADTIYSQGSHNSWRKRSSVSLLYVISMFLMHCYLMRHGLIKRLHHVLTISIAISLPYVLVKALLSR